MRWSGDRGLDDVLGGDSLTDGTSISVTLISGDLPPPPPPTTPGAPTGLAATANGPSQIDLAWTAPASTGGSAITGYKIEVSPDGSSWSDLVADTASTDTAYAHMGLGPATTRHYRVSAINAVGTSDASDSDDTTTASTNTAATDRAALVALYNATSGPNWTIDTNWLTTAALSEWYGVTTDVDGRVTHVYLAQNELNGELPVELGDLTNLQILYLNQNMLSGAIPVALGKLTNLEQLSLSQNMLSGEIPAELGDLTNLRQLYLAQNELSGEIPAALGDKLTNLEQLSLSQNMLSGAIPAALGDLASLQILYLAQNELSGEIPVGAGGS